MVRALSTSYQSAPFSMSEKEGKATPGLLACKGTDRMCVSMSPPPAWWAQVNALDE